MNNEMKKAINWWIKLDIMSKLSISDSTKSGHPFNVKNDIILKKYKQYKN